MVNVAVIFVSNGWVIGASFRVGIAFGSGSDCSSGSGSGAAARFLVEGQTYSILVT